MQKLSFKGCIQFDFLNL